jgi:hypothetical protein
MQYDPRSVGRVTETSSPAHRGEPDDGRLTAGGPSSPILRHDRGSGGGLTLRKVRLVADTADALREQQGLAAAGVRGSSTDPARTLRCRMSISSSPSRITGANVAASG